MYNNKYVYGIYFLLLRLALLYVTFSADFGLSRQKQGLMQSVVGTILYSCPELVKVRIY